MAIDHLVKGFRLTLGNPYLVCLVPLSMWCTSSIASARLVLVYTCMLWFFHLLVALDRRYRQGHLRQPKRRNFRDQVIVITGGSDGLGHALVSLFAMRGACVIVLDIQAALDPIPGVEYICCDVSKEADVSHCTAHITTQYEKVDVFVSNAGIMRPGKLLDLTSTGVWTTLSVNLVAHFLLAKHFVPLVQRATHGQWVTIASTLGYVGTHSLGVYCASKAATISFHETLTVEVPNLITTLIIPGQLDSRMFQEVVNPSPFLAPTLHSLDLAKSIESIVQAGRAGEFAFPFYARYMGILRLLPSGLQKLVRALAKLDRAAANLIT